MSLFDFFSLIYTPYVKGRSILMNFYLPLKKINNNKKYIFIVNDKLIWPNKLIAKAEIKISIH